MDFITGLPISKNRYGTEFDSIFVVINRFTKITLYIPCKKTIDAAELVDIFIDKITSCFGNPESIVSDRGIIFTSKFWSILCYILKIKSKFFMVFYPQINSQTKR
jgi:hypothetical protein